jgi:outer membrane biogenesis lipoprotein LolB
MRPSILAFVALFVAVGTLLLSGCPVGTMSAPQRTRDDSAYRGHDVDESTAKCQQFGCSL